MAKLLWEADSSPHGEHLYQTPPLSRQSIQIFHQSALLHGVAKQGVWVAMASEAKVVSKLATQAPSSLLLVKGLALRQALGCDRASGSAGRGALCGTPRA